MNNSDYDVEQLHVKKLKELAKEYSVQGYEVLANAIGFQHPRKIGSYEPDLIVRKGNKEIIIEIISKAQTKYLQQKLEQLATYADNREDTRFDIVFTNPRPRPKTVKKTIDEGELLKEFRRSVILNAEAAYRREQYRESFYLYWTLLKNILQEYAARNGVQLDERNGSLARINIDLKSQKLIELDDYKMIRSLTKERNKMVHSSDPSNFNINENCIEIAKKLVKYFNDLITQEASSKKTKQ